MGVVGCELEGHEEAGEEVVIKQVEGAEGKLRGVGQHRAADVGTRR